MNEKKSENYKNRGILLSYMLLHKKKIHISMISFRNEFNKQLGDFYTLNVIF